MTIKVRSAKNKGMKFQKQVVESILMTLTDLTINDLRSVPSGVPGEDIWRSEAAMGVFPYSVECKNTEKLSIWKALKQAEEENRKDTPLLVFKRNRSDAYCCLKFDDFLKLISQINYLEGIYK